jgi:hypothetical protein
MMRYRFLLLAILAGATPALAQHRPLARPIRDVVVEYRSSGLPRGPLDGSGDVITMRFNGRFSRIWMVESAVRGYVVLDAGG